MATALWLLTFSFACIAFGSELWMIFYGVRDKYRGWASLFVLLNVAGLAALVLWGYGVQWWFVRQGLAATLIFIMLISLHVADIICHPDDKWHNKNE